MENKMINKKIFLSAIISMIAFMFMIGSISAVQSAVNLGTAGNYVILAKSGVSTTGVTAITGDIGVSPIDSTGITGFGLIMDSSNTFATSSLVTGKIYAADYTDPTPTKMTTAVSDMETAYTTANGLAPGVTELGAGEIGGMTLAPGVYKWSTGLLISTDVTLSGEGVYIFQIAGNLNIASGKHVILSGGAQAKNIFWVVGDTTTLGTTSIFNGNILDQTAIILNTGATLNGRALAQTAVTLDANSVSLPEAANDLIITNTLSTDSNYNSGNGNAGTYGSEVVTAPSSGATVIVTNPRGIVSIVAGASVTITRDGETIYVTSVNGRTRLNSGDVKVETELSAEVEGNNIRLTQLNGTKAEIKIMPSTASETALAKLRIKVCNETNNCTITLKEVGAEAKLVYQIKAQKNVKVLGLFRAKMNVETNVDAKTGEIISTKIPWWASISTAA